MDLFAAQLLPELRHLEATISEKTTMTLILSVVCCRAMELFEPMATIAKTLVSQPDHLMPLPDQTVNLPNSRLSVGGECIEEEDLKTLDYGQWLNDKIENAFLGLLKTQMNVTDIFVFPSYTAVLWENGNLGHWLFKKGQFLKFKHLILPINVNGNH
ncbi:uncharacterized protein LOC132716552 [Ruditapes philippinarum]|uniref:uncharacterized protein LOC132716552 n=1 Tax=Ruditapes philippinarum TaxID=129788 RepID=UPI00295A9112|nr:uncharacterized protein LOC132716552 [Ruditapes philippinarum]